jgi:hypothetical protein
MEPEDTEIRLSTVSQLGIYNKAGELVFKTKSSHPIENVSEFIKLSDLPKGEYYVIIQDSMDIKTDKLVIE